MTYAGSREPLTVIASIEQDARLLPYIFYLHGCKDENGNKVQG